MLKEQDRKESKMATVVKEKDKPKAKAKATATTTDTNFLSPYKKAADWIKDQLKKAKYNTCVAELTPELAEFLLENNEDNRKLRQAQINAMVRDILAGNWKLNGEAIIISDDGKLNDGQHRCWAVIEAKKPIKTFFSFGVSRDSRTTLDQGANRRLADYLAIKGNRYSVETAAAAAYGFEYVHKNTLHMGKSSRPTRAEVGEFVSAYPNLDKSVEFIAPNKIPQALGGRGFLCFVHWVLARKNKAKADEFFNHFISGFELERNSPILYVRNRLINEGHLRRSIKAELIFRAWNAWRTGKSFGTIRVQGGAFPEIES